MQDITQYRLSGLNKFDKLELEANPSFEITPTDIPPDAQGEPLLYLAVVSVTAISALAAFLLKKNNGESFEEVVEEIRADGSVFRRRICYSKDSSEAPEAEVIRQIRGSALEQL